jgi:hypothetical protein
MPYSFHPTKKYLKQLRKVNLKNLNLKNSLKSYFIKSLMIRLQVTALSLIEEKDKQIEELQN